MPWCGRLLTRSELLNPMKCQAAASFLVLTLTALPAWAQSLPAIKSGPTNEVAACVTPGRLMAFVKERNPLVDPRFDSVATEYMRHGEVLGVRWDYAFFQMLLETGYLSFSRGNGQPGIVRPSQNNFAGLGATGRGQRGEHFPDIATGVKAHMQHLLLYAGDRIVDPVADRTRKVQEWGILTDWQRKLNRPVTFTDLSRKWAPNDRRYASKLHGIAQAYFDTVCNRPDPRPELVAEARGGRSNVASATNSKVSGTELARRALEEGRAKDAPRSSLGASSIVSQAAAATAGSAIGESRSKKTAISDSWQGGPPETDRSAKIQTVSAGAAAAAAAKPAGEQRCRVWTASYGGQKAIIIRAEDDGLINYTVLDVNEGSEKRETEAYIAAYAKGGEPIGEFPNQLSALDRAFELCPEG